MRRCLVLADALAEAGWDITFVCTLGAERIVQALTRRSFAIIEPHALDARVRAQGFSCALLVVDDYRLDATFESHCRSWAQRILVIDDLANRHHDCDVLVDQSPGRLANDYLGLVPSGAELLLGPSYALLDRRFLLRRHQRRPVGDVERIFLNFGTTDTINATGVALDAIGEANVGTAIDLVLGSAAPHLWAIRAQISAMPSVELHLDVDDMAAVMKNADLAVGAGGVGSLERCVLGLPSLILTVAENQIASATGLAKAGAACYLGEIANYSKHEIARAIQRLAGDIEARQAMSGAALRLVDGLGAIRVRVACNLPQHAKDGRRVTIRQATSADSAMMLAWQSAPGIRQYSRNPTAPRPQEHEHWLQAMLDDTGCIFNIVECGDEPVGILRFDKLPSGDGYEISILIAAPHQGLGIGGCALILGSQLLPTARIIAAIHPENQASIHMFERAGYWPVRPGEWELDPAKYPIQEHS